MLQRILLAGALLIASAGLAPAARAAALRGQILHDGSGSGLYFVMAFRASTTPIAGMDVRAIPGPYEIPDLGDDVYVLFGWRDSNGDMMPGVNEPLGWFGTPFPALVEIQGGQDVDGLDITLRRRLFTHELRGKVAYTGVQSGRIWIVPHANPIFALTEIAGSPWTISQVGDAYRSFVFAPGAYYVSAFMDVNGNLLPDPGEPFGTRPSAVMVTAPGGITSGLDILMTDFGVAVEERTWSGVKALYGR